MENKVVSVTVMVPKESHELAVALAGIAKVIIAQSKDGVGLDDIAPLVAELLKTAGGEGFKDLSGLVPEIKADPVKFALALAISLDEVL